MSGTGAGRASMYGAVARRRDLTVCAVQICSFADETKSGLHWQLRRRCDSHGIALHMVNAKR
jgi:hypothetical protein